MKNRPSLNRFAPEGGWKERAYYVVLVSFREGNPEHKAILYTGFLNSGEPGSYSGVFNPTYEPEFLSVQEIHSMKVISEIGDML